MSKLTKTVGKWKLWTVVSAIIVAAGIIVAAIFGFNADYTASDVKTMTVKLDSYVSVSDVKTEKVKDICESALEKAGLKDAYTMDGETSGGGELVYVFSAKTDDKKLAEVKTAVESALETATADSGELAGAILYVTANSERAAATLAAGYLWRAALAGAVVLLAEFIYIAVRYKLNMGRGGRDFISDGNVADGGPRRFGAASRHRVPRLCGSVCASLHDGDLDVGVEQDARELQNGRV